MSDHASAPGEHSADLPEPAGVDSVEAYETEEGVVFYDAENPLAWLETSQTLSLREQA
ncbi:hypothetical protein G9464_08210 [Halostella sp. JP-L12]|uniref:DUF7331 family protein n=1 Tax=Halostella TaxID=1843185 RepID=UPI0013CE623D|nr:MULTISPECIES: hypothetical protein [Halostella]NHN47578.1 hypothetical protein [Halostella sp. JP-L12]